VEESRLKVESQLFCLQVESSQFSRKSSTLSRPQVTFGLSGIRWADWSDFQAYHWPAGQSHSGVVARSPTFEHALQTVLGFSRKPFATHNFGHGLHTFPSLLSLAPYEERWMSINVIYSSLFRWMTAQEI